MQTLEEILSEVEPRVYETNIDPHNIDLYFSYNVVDPIWEESENRDSEIGLMRSVLPKLPPWYRNLYELAYVNNLNQKELTEELNINQSAISKALKRLSIILKATLEVPTLEQEEIIRNLNRLDGPKKRCIRCFIKTYRIKDTADKMNMSEYLVQQSINQVISSNKISRQFKEYISAIMRIPKIKSHRKCG